MPNSQTFKIRAIKKLILSRIKENDIILDPFANDADIKNYIPKSCKYISNDLDPQYDTDYHLEAQDFLKLFEDNSADVILYDPPYSSRQVSECYKSLGKTVSMSDTSSGYFTKFKKEISRVLKQGGIVISCGWNTNGIGKKYNMNLVEVLDIAHGGSHYDTLVTVERKIVKAKVNLLSIK